MNPFTEKTGRGNKISAEESTYIREQLKAGRTQSAIAKELGRSTSSMSRHLNRQTPAAQKDVSINYERPKRTFMRVEGDSFAYQYIKSHQAGDESMSQALDRLCKSHSAKCEDSKPRGFFSKLFGG